jgi:hypothetical protein
MFYEQTRISLLQPTFFHLIIGRRLIFKQCSKRHDTVTLQNVFKTPGKEAIDPKADRSLKSKLVRRELKMIHLQKTPVSPMTILFLNCKLLLLRYYVPM